MDEVNSKTHKNLRSNVKHIVSGDGIPVVRVAIDDHFESFDIYIAMTFHQARELRDQLNQALGDAVSTINEMGGDD